MPDWLMPLRLRAAEAIGRTPDELAYALINAYPPGKGMGWHVDRPMFGDVFGISLLAPARLRFRRRRTRGWERYTLCPEPRSAYILAGEARDDWEHSVAPVERLRYSITFRTRALSVESCEQR